MRQEHHKQLLSFLRSGNYQLASDFLVGVKGEYENDSDYWYYLAHIARRVGDVKQAEHFCKKAIELSPDSRNANFEMGIIYQTTGEYKKAISFLKKLIENPTKDTGWEEMIDTLNSLALTYKKAGDKTNALKYYNLALETLAQDIYEHIKGQPIREVEAKYPDNNLEGWMRLAFGIAVKNTAKDGIKTARIPDGETAKKIIEQNPLMGFAMHDKDGVRYLLPAYFASFSNALRSSILYSNIVNNIGTLFAETGEVEEAKKCFLEAIDFTPDGVKFDNPHIGLENLTS
mgnify:FL=1